VSDGPSPTDEHALHETVADAIMSGRSVTRTPKGEIKVKVVLIKN